MRITQRVTAAAVAAMAFTMLASTQVTSIASADEPSGEFTIGGRILEAYKATGGEAKWGEATGDERPALGGRFQTFEKDNTHFYWKASVTNGVAHPVSGAIFAKYGTLQWERGVLKYPTSDPIGIPDKGVKQFFQGGNVYSGTTTKTFTVWGGILDKYAAAKGPTGKLGMPVSNEYRVGRNYAQNFQGGVLVFP